MSTTFRTFVAFSVIGLTTSVAAADHPTGGYVLAPDQFGVDSMAGGAPVIFYINKNGGTFYASNSNDSRTNHSTIPSSTSSIAPWNISASNWASVKSCITDEFSRFNVTVTDVDPGNVPHYEIVIAGNPQDVGMDNGVGGVSPWTNDCSIIPNSIVYVFAEVYGTDYNGVCETAAQEVAHSFGLDHEYLCQDPMTYLFNCPEHKVFQDTNASCGEYSARTCACGQSSQNSVQMLYDRIGAATQTTNNPPTVSITSPGNGSTQAPGFGVAANASDDNGVARVDFAVDGNVVSSDTSAPYGFQTSTSLADGSHSISATAYDGDGATSSDQISVTVHTPGPGEPDAGPGGNPGDPDAGPGGNPNGDDDDTGGNNGFITGGCNAGSGGTGLLALIGLAALVAIRRRRV